MAKNATTRGTSPTAINTSGKRKRTFTFEATAARSVLLVGDFTNWLQNPIPMQQRSDGFWQTDLQLPPGTHHYRFLVDNEWCDDPECMIRVPNAFGSQNCVCQVP